MWPEVPPHGAASKACGWFSAASMGSLFASLISIPFMSPFPRVADGWGWHGLLWVWWFLHASLQCPSQRVSLAKQMDDHHFQCQDCNWLAFLNPLYLDSQLILYPIVSRYPIQYPLIIYNYVQYIQCINIFLKAPLILHSKFQSYP